MMSTPHPLLTLLETLTNSLPLTQEKVSSALGTSLRPASLQNNPFFQLLEGGACYQGMISRVDLRLPNGKHPGSAPMLVLEVAPGTGLRRQECFEAFGEIHELRIPTPRQPAGSPMLFVFSQGWGTLKLGLTDDAAEEVVTILMDTSR